MNNNNNHMYNYIEEFSLNAWPALQSYLYDGWVIRLADGYTKRSNSVSPIYNGYMELLDKVEFCEHIYTMSHQPAIFKIFPSYHTQELDDILIQRGYSIEDITSVRVLDLSNYQGKKPKNIIYQTRLDQRWMDGFLECSNKSDEEKVISHKLHQNILGDVIFVSKMVEGKIVGCGYGAFQRGVVGIYDIVVDKEYRNQGLGKDILDGILSYATQKKITLAYLAVVVGNTPAEKLYEKLGFMEQYRYWYRVSPKILQ
ncbi:GNAT family N-acetyltransferase [Mobilitalea sibirica]|uniref:GNAT family N-acetyltransferase n=1 Tax=Mobilitalea sibirica TaxID=1462919 RepID=A0A8J7H2R7_9FIRM|nr:GNAT family N-acetyltransferase [Mobilitalea sibirica]MBH1941158.1 GNAT family N-acetyltransferase [Mobilitalea sibirica]